ncbi:V-type proton ATPase 16 kDa proteolipid subunit [Oleoguttula sp. CCFEE 5521]
MESYGHSHVVNPGATYLTKLYTDAKRRSLISIDFKPPLTVSPSISNEQFAALLRKFRIQKDRFTAWGLNWNDENGKGDDVAIDGAVAQAGFTDLVESVMRNIDEVLAQLESVNASGLSSKAGEKTIAPAPFDETRYLDLLNEYTTSIDTLYDLSQNREAMTRGEHPKFQPEEPSAPAPSVRGNTIPTTFNRYPPSIADSEVTLVNPRGFLRPPISPYAGLPPLIDISALRLPEEGPPPYESIGVPVTTRLVGRLIRARIPESVASVLGSENAEVPVLVEYSGHDATYQNTGVPPPLHRLEWLAGALQPIRVESQHNISLLGYFEDPSAPRIGLIYDLPYALQFQMLTSTAQPPETFAPLSLLNLIRKARPSTHAPPVDTEPPPLETRFRLALRLTEQLHALHTQGLTHGNINSSSVLFGTMSNDSPALRTKRLRAPIWASFDVFAKYSLEGLGRAANLNIYRHPSDHPQDTSRDIAADVRYDVYSLALLLLEIGLWHPLGELYKAKYTIRDFKIRLQQLWIPKLAAKCGLSYMRAVQSCMAIVDRADGEGLTTEGVYDAVLPRLRKCCALDDEVDEVDVFERARHVSEPNVRASQLQDTNEALAGDLARRFTDTQRSTKSSAINVIARRPLPTPLSRSTTMMSDTSNLSIPQAPSGAAIKRTPSIASTAESLARHISATPSFQDYKRKIVLIQKRWRERCDAAHEQAAERAVNAHRIATDRIVAAHGRAAHAHEKAASRMIAAHEKAAHRAARKQSRHGHGHEKAAAEHGSRPKSKLQEFPAMQLPQALVDEWANETADKLRRLVERALRGLPESSSIGFSYYGETPESAKPTYVITCKSTHLVKHMLKRHFRWDANACHLRVEKGRIARCRRAVPRSAASRSMGSRYDEQEHDPVNPDYQERPVCGASIGAYKDEEHLPPVSFGGVVTIDGRSYGMSVHHMLEAGDEELEPEEDDSDDDDTSSLLSMDDGAISLDSDDDNSTVRQLSAPSDLSLDEDEQADGETAGVMPGDGEEIDITQPALDDAKIQHLHAEEDEDDEDSASVIDEDHILSYKLGQIHASSGLKRSTFHSTESGYRGISASLPQEIDWALFELLPPRARPFNIVPGGRKYCDSTSTSATRGNDCFPVSIHPTSRLPNTKVHCLGRTSGLASGTISSTMELLKLHGRSTFAASWTVLGGFGVGGDSGAWIISSEGKVCGHVLAERAGRTYICPMELMFEDIKATLGAGTVGLPVEGADEKARCTATVTDVRADSGFEEAVARLRLEDQGGVALPCSPKKKGVVQKCEMARVIGPVGSVA